jgi:hypothetical protein
MDILGTYKDEPVVLQSKPQRRTISCLHAANQHLVQDTYFLQFPYIVFCKYPFDTLNVPKKYCRIGFSPEPISSLDTKIYLPPLPNTHYCGVTFAVCGCEGNIKTSVEKFWQTSFKTAELPSGEMSLCKMFGMLYCESNVHIALRYWEELNLVLFNERMCRTSFSLSVG